MRIKFVQDCIDLIRLKETNFIIIHFKYLLRSIKLKLKLKKIKTKSKIKIAFLCMYSTDIQNISIFDKLLNNSKFDPYFIVNPDCSRSDKNLIHQYDKTFNELVQIYGTKKVLHGYIADENKFIDYSSEFDIMTTNNPYDSMSHTFFKIEYWIKKNIPVFYISYFYSGRCIITIQNLRLYYLNYLWIWFVENKEVLRLANKYRIKKAKNLYLSGYPKMDKFFNYLKKGQDKKNIIIAPHHTIQNSGFKIGNFLKYYNLFLELPKKYPYINFIFRPHPLLIYNLKNNIWGEEKTNNYLNKLLSHKNIVLSEQGDYLKLFSESDGLIHDCGSFMAEYLYLKRPVAFMMSCDTNNILTDFGKKCIQSHYCLFQEGDFYDFIENVVLGDRDYKKYFRNDFVNNEVAINYPYSTQIIYNKILKELS
ncbi:CDP-glycerol glycerophosphotransferase family protein [Campylobacter molothri]|uniref:CDP-glycerol glycerophosphotransferase family protein n=1 Tax=Campylobacter molothri TaxID=1032242 RepID=UPI001EFBBC62|nr:CDP-glycerol glycerophosphotransferase family protein [Campylobacter sp. RM10537]MBZ7949038.1 CDP-glycerol glycerophosphotransferase family protein [Campylobacter sp. RM10534]ULN99997.1 putative glycerophosphotransferase [Campylobacter sp. RM10537]